MHVLTYSTPHFLGQITHWTSITVAFLAHWTMDIGQRSIADVRREQTAPGFWIYLKMFIYHLTCFLAIMKLIIIIISS